VFAQKEYMKEINLTDLIRQDLESYQKLLDREKEITETKENLAVLYSIKPSLSESLDQFRELINAWIWEYRQEIGDVKGKTINLPLEDIVDRFDIVIQVSEKQ
jgi:hypothetical protein